MGCTVLTGRHIGEENGSKPATKRSALFVNYYILQYKIEKLKLNSKSVVFKDWLNKNSSSKKSIYPDNAQPPLNTTHNFYSVFKRKFLPFLSQRNIKLTYNHTTPPQNAPLSARHSQTPLSANIGMKYTSKFSYSYSRPLMYKSNSLLKLS